MQNIEDVSLETGASLWNYFFIVLKGKKPLSSHNSISSENVSQQWKLNKDIFR